MILLPVQEKIHHFFILPDIGTEIAQLENDKSLSDSEKLQKKEALISDYSVKTQRIHYHQPIAESLYLV